MAPPSARHVRRPPYPERLQPLDQRRPHLLVARYSRCPPRLLDPGTAPLLLAQQVHGPVQLLARPGDFLASANFHTPHTHPPLLQHLRPPPPPSSPHPPPP